MKKKRVLINLIIIVCFLCPYVFHAEEDILDETCTYSAVTAEDVLSDLPETEDRDESVLEADSVEEDDSDADMDACDMDSFDAPAVSDESFEDDGLIIDEVDEWEEMPIEEIQDNRAEDSGILLTFYANDNGITDFGHSWLSVTNNTGHTVYIGEYILPAGDGVYIGARGGASMASCAVAKDIISGEEDENIKGGAIFNFEAYADNSKDNKAATLGPNGDVNTLYSDYAFFSAPISEEDLSTIYYYMKSFGAYNVFTNNCTTFAYHVWNDLVDEQYRFPFNLLEVSDQPTFAKNYILNSLGGEEHTGGLPRFLGSNCNCLFVSPGGHLQPLNKALLSAPYLLDEDISAINCEQVYLDWGAVTEKIGVNDDNITGYERH